MKARPVLKELGEGRGGKAGKEFAEVTVDDAVSWIGRFSDGAVANFEATRFAWGRKNHVTLEINGSGGSLFFDLEDMNRLKYFSVDDPKDARGFRDIIVTELEHPYVSAWWPPGHITGYENTFVNAFSDFVKAVAAGERIQPSFEDGLKNVKVLAAIEESVRTRGWVNV
jgi:predicted dehydrogenase